MTLSTMTTGATSYIFNQNRLQTGATFYVSSGTVQGIFTVQQPNNDTADPPIAIKTLTTTEGASNMFHSAFLYGKIPNDLANCGEFIITASTKDIGADVGGDELRLKRPEIGFWTGSNCNSGTPTISLRAQAQQFPNTNTGNDVLVTPGTTTIYGVLQIANPLGGSGLLTVSGPSTLVANAATDTVLSVKGAASQSANLQQWRNSSNVILSSVGADGAFYTSTITVSNVVKFSTGIIDSNGKMALGVNSSQVHRLFVLDDDNISPTAYFEKAYSGTYPNGNWDFAYGAFEVANRNQTNNNVEYISFSGNSIGGYSGALIGSVNVDHATSTGDLFFWTRGLSSTGSRLFIDKEGPIGLNTTSPGAQLDVNPYQSIEKGIVVKGAAGQSANLLELKDSSDNILISADYGGGFASRYYEDISNNKGYFDTGATGVDWQLNNRVSSNVPLQIIGAGSQSANLQEWKNSAGTILSTVSASGVFSGDGSGLTNLQFPSVFSGALFVGLTSGATFQAFIPTKAITIKNIVFTADVASAGGSGDTFTCGDTSGHSVAVISANAAAAGTTTSATGTASISAGTTVYMRMDSGAVTKPQGNLACGYVMQ